MVRVSFHPERVIPTTRCGRLSFHSLRILEEN